MRSQTTIEHPFKGSAPAVNTGQLCDGDLDHGYGLAAAGRSRTTKALPKTIAGKLDFPEEAATGAAQASLYLFMLSHYVADANMPCHADARALASYTGKLHKEWEKYISAQVKDFPNPDQVGTMKPAG